MSTSLWPTDLMSFYRNQNALFEAFLYESDMANKADYVVVNTFEELEGKEIVEGLSKGYPALAVGPVFLANFLEGRGSITSMWEDDPKCLQWLDMQKLAFMLYVSFDSIAIKSQEQLHELALGLEVSGHSCGLSALIEQRANLWLYLKVLRIEPRTEHCFWDGHLSLRFFRIHLWERAKWGLLLNGNVAVKTKKIVDATNCTAKWRESSQQTLYSVWRPTKLVAVAAGNPDRPVDGVNTIGMLLNLAKANTEAGYPGVSTKDEGKDLDFISLACLGTRQRFRCGGVLDGIF
eukprot:Gb_08067 [translate_table: standard]